jgi:metal-sulfur cluster biosynthetic enzyme
MQPLSGDGVKRTTPADRHTVVAEASRRTTHTLPTDGPRDPRYSSTDPDIDRLWRALCDVADPELPISLVDLGLIRDVRRCGGAVEVDVTFTATACPCMAFIIQDVQHRLVREEGVQTVTVRDVWDPPWTSEQMTAYGRTMLKNFGVAA